MTFLSRHALTSRKFIATASTFAFTLSLPFFSFTSSLSALSYHEVPEQLVVESIPKGDNIAALSPEQIQHIEENWHQIVDVKPNKLGAARIDQHLEANNLSALNLETAKSHVDELTTVTGSTSAIPPVTSLGVAVLPTHVDNTTLPSFPLIGNQGNIGSCVAWASTYYQASHEKGLLNGTNNKTNTAGIFSPKWTYDLLNNGVDGGLNIITAYQFLSQNGIVGINSLPYNTNYLAWDLNPQDWINALSNRTTPPQWVSGIGGDQQNLQAIKQLLNNGHVLTFGTFIESWVFTTVKADPTSASNPYVGQYAASWMNGMNGGHMMTIVGYDDNIWIDINGNGKVDQGEKGAFLIANSWSPSWGNKGLIWISYDAFLTKSGVVNGPNTGRVAAAAVLNSYVVSAVPLAAHYTPKLIAQFSLTQEQRNQIEVSAGISATSQTTPAQVITNAGLSYQGGTFEFDGTKGTAPETATFAIDLTDLLAQNETADSVAHRFYLIVNDDKVGDPTILNSFTLIDLLHNHKVSYSQVPLSCDNGKITPYIDYKFAP